jgi:hypothetical protein
MFVVYRQPMGEGQAPYGKAESEPLAVNMIRNAADIQGSDQLKWSSILGRLFPFCEVFKKGKLTDKFFVEQVQ